MLPVAKPYLAKAAHSELSLCGELAMLSAETAVWSSLVATAGFGARRPAPRLACLNTSTHRNPTQSFWGSPEPEKLRRGGRHISGPLHGPSFAKVL